MMQINNTWQRPREEAPRRHPKNTVLNAAETETVGGWPHGTQFAFTTQNGFCA
jgi:hypothetical protein